MLPLDPYIPIILACFKKRIPIEETKIAAFDFSGELFKNENSNMYCHIWHSFKNSLSYVSFFKSTSNTFEGVADDFIFHSVNFVIPSEQALFVIVNSLY
jgi:hypothetical protein